MTYDNTHHDDLHLHSDPDIERVESLLDALASEDRDAMTTAQQSRVLESVSQVFAPEPISLEQRRHEQIHTSASRKWNFRFAAAAALATVTTLGIVATQPWKSGAPLPDSSSAPNQGAWTLASFEEDIDAYLTLDEHESNSIDEAVASWELWAQTIESDLDVDSLNDEYGISELHDGAL